MLLHHSVRLVRRVLKIDLLYVHIKALFRGYFSHLSFVLLFLLSIFLHFRHINSSDLCFGLVHLGAQHSSAVSFLYTLFYIVFMPYCTSSFPPYLFVDLYHPPFLLPALDELYLHSTICSLETPSAYMLLPLFAVMQPSVFHSSYRCCSPSFVACFLSLLVHFFVVLLLSPTHLSASPIVSRHCIISYHFSLLVLFSLSHCCFCIDRCPLESHTHSLTTYSLSQSTRYTNQRIRTSSTATSVTH